jgi:hypothetical protein
LGGLVAGGGICLPDTFFLRNNIDASDGIRGNRGWASGQAGARSSHWKTMGVAAERYEIVKLRLRLLYHICGLLSIGQCIGDFWEIGAQFGIIWDIARSGPIVGSALDVLRLGAWVSSSNTSTPRREHIAGACESFKVLASAMGGLT